MPLDSDKIKFLTAVAKYLTRDQARRSIGLEMGNPEDRVWQQVRIASPLVGWLSEQEAAERLIAWFEEGGDL